jgi:hypothetical protein
MTKNARLLDAVAEDIHALQRDSYLDIGDLLIEAKDSCEHGEWGEWLETEFDWSQDTAKRYMDSARLAAKFRTVRNLKVPARVIYELAGDLEDADLPAIVEALAKASKGKKSLTVAAAEDEIALTRARVKFGDHPEATLDALSRLYENAWRDKAIEALKEKQPKTDEVADKIVNDIHRAHVAKLYASHGALPNVPDDSLFYLEDDVPEKHREKVLEKLLAAPQPLTKERVWSIICNPDDDDPETTDDSDDTDDPDDTEDTEDTVPPPPPAATLDPDLLEALRTVLKHARCIMPTKVGGIDGSELAEIVLYVDQLNRIACGGEHKKMVADRAAARGKRGEVRQKGDAVLTKTIAESTGIELDESPLGPSKAALNGVIESELRRQAGNDIDPEGLATEKKEVVAALENDAKSLTTEPVGELTKDPPGELRKSSPGKLH